MKRIWRLAKQFVLFAAVALTGIGCGKQAENFQGKWIDVNGSTMLEIKGNKMIVSYGEWSDEYRYKIRTEYGTTYLSNVKDDGCFGIMTELTVEADGSMRAYDMILDADSHNYRFVKEDRIEQEYEIQDLSQDLPKEIESREIDYFVLSFQNMRGTYELDESWEAGRYSWVIEKDEEGKYKMSFQVVQDSYLVINFLEEVGEDYVFGLADVLLDAGVIAQNGYYMKNNESFPKYSLCANYASGEMISVSAEGGVAQTCVFDMAALLDYAALQNLRYEEEEVTSPDQPEDLFVVVTDPAIEEYSEYSENAYEVSTPVVGLEDVDPVMVLSLKESLNVKVELVEKEADGQEVVIEVLAEEVLDQGEAMLIYTMLFQETSPLRVTAQWSKGDETVTAQWYAVYLNGEALYKQYVAG